MLRLAQSADPVVAVFHCAALVMLRDDGNLTLRDAFSHKLPLA